MSNDGGPPRSINGLGWLSCLGAWLARFGVRPVRNVPGRPDQDCRQERFDAKCKAKTAALPRSSIPAQPQAFDRLPLPLRHERLRKALGMKRSGEVYELRPTAVAEQSSVRTARGIMWYGGMAFVGEAFAGEMVDLHACA